MAYTNIDDPSAHFQTALYTGNGSTQSITNDGNSDMQPDWVWIKSRSNASWHSLQDSSRGATKTLFSNTTNAETTYTNAQTSFDSDGFSLAADSSGGSVNVNSRTYVGWQWKANGGTTASNSNGSITSTVQANTDAGFSIVTYTGTGNTATVGHGLGVAPKIIIGKRRSQAANWWVGGSILTSAQTLYLNLQNAIDTVGEAAIFNVTTSTTFKLGTDTNRNAYDATHVAYCFAEKQGFSKFGTYEGNGNADGPFIYTGFKPAWVMIKNIDNGGYDWAIMDSTRTPTNADGTYEFLWPNLSGAEFTDGDSGINMEIDFLSNGFKIRTARPELNLASTFSYMAFAENPFVTSTGVPTTAR